MGMGNKRFSKVKDLYSRTKEISSIVEENLLFPADIYSSSFLDVLKMLKVKDCVEDEKLINFALSICSNQPMEEITIQKSKALANYLSTRNLFSQISKETIAQLRSIKWLLCTENILSAPSEACTASSLLGGLYPVQSDQIPKLPNELGVTTRNTVTLEQLDLKLQFIIENYSKDGILDVKEYKSILKEVEKMMGEQEENSYEPKFFEMDWIEKKGKLLPTSMFIKTKLNIEPIRLSLPRRYQQLIGEKIEELNKETAIQILEEFQLGEKVEADKEKAIIKLIQFIVPKLVEGEIIPVLSTELELLEPKQVVNNDATWKSMEELNKLKFIHNDLTQTNFLKTLRIKSVRQILAEDDKFGVPFAQSQAMSDRIREILHEYSESKVPIEFIQNAEDAKASRIQFIFETKTKYAEKALLGEKLAVLQNCDSLYIYNDSYFSEKDFERIIKVGSGGKKSELESIGQIGRASCRERV